MSIPDLPPDAKITSVIPDMGGQHVLVRPGVKIECPTAGLTVIIDNGQSQHINREIAADMILAGLTHPKFR
jgi:protein subunit release factor A